MSGQNSSTPVKVPSSAASYTPATLDPDLRSQINTLLLRDGHVTKIQDQLLHSLNAHSSNWPTTLQARAISLLRSGRVNSFPHLLREILDDVRQETALAGSSSSSSSSDAASKPNGEVNGSVKKVNGTSGGTEEAQNGAGGGAGTAQQTQGGESSLAVPQAVIEEALKVTRESLEMVCEIEENGAT